MHWIILVLILRMEDYFRSFFLLRKEYYEFSIIGSKKEDMK